MIFQENDSIPGDSFYSFDGNFRISRFNDRNNNFQARQPLINMRWIDIKNNSALARSVKSKGGCDPERFTAAEGNNTKKRKALDEKGVFLLCCPR